MTTQIEVYAGTAGHSAWFSSDLGQTWVHPNSHSGLYLEARVWSYSSHPDEPHLLYAGTDMGLFCWDERTARWTALASPMTDIWALAQDPDDAQVLYAGTRPAGFYRSVDAGLTWQVLPTPGIQQFSEINMGPTRVTQILFDPLEHNTLWAVGPNEDGQLGDGTTENRSTPVQVASDVTAVSVGSVHTMFLKSDNTLWTVGFSF